MNSLPSITGAVASGTAVASLSDYVQPNLGHGLRIWWAFYWRNMLIALALTFVLGLVSEMFYETGAISLEARNAISKVGPYVLGFLSAIFMIHYVVRKRFKAFRIGLLSIQGDSFGREVEPTRSRTIRIWWTFTWRTTIYVIFLFIAANIVLSPVLGLGAAISPAAGMFVAQLVGTAVAGAASMFAIYSNILDEDIGDFRVSLLPIGTKGPVSAPGEPPASTAPGNPSNAPTS